MSLRMTESDLDAYFARHPELARPGKSKAIPKPVEMLGPASHEPSVVFLWGIKSAELPEPETEYFFAEKHGRDFRFDFAWTGPKIALECDGAVHGIKGRRLADLVKFRWAEILGWHVVHARPIELQDGRALNLIGAMLRGDRAQQIDVLRSWGSEK